MLINTPVARFAIATAGIAGATFAYHSKREQHKPSADMNVTLAASAAALDSPAAYGAPLTPPPVSSDEQKAFLDQSAQTAWAFIRRNYQPNTGLVVAHETYQFVTVWDIASTLAGYYAAHQLGLTTDADYHDRMTRALETLRDAPLYDGKAFNKLYDARSGSMVGRNEERSSSGYGWSTLDTGRLLIWLKILAQSDPTLAPLAEQVVSRLKLDAMVHDGYLQGRDIDLRTGKPGDYQEGRLGYEQYAAQGFAAWGEQAKHALEFSNARVVTTDGYTFPADKRGGDLLTSEPFILMGMELGWRTPDWQKYARMVFDAQQQRFEKTGVMTMTSEDAIPEPPAYFYYYLLYRDGKPFVVTTPSGAAAPHGVRWVSAKAAFGWHALLPSNFTWQALQTVRNAEAPNRGWTAGVFENSKQSTRSFNLNTAAIVLEAVLYAQRHCPLIETSCGAG
ncbi:MAG TPA: DUF3131 domain-containing protein [Gemmatimonadaceae bacterium]|nr:DUF3131 domain-containing protein [Gemmatimonadaceae bacterium]